MSARTPIVDVPPPPRPIVEAIVRRALLEDLGEAGDVTSEAVTPAGAHMRAALRARGAGRAAGLFVLAEVFGALDPAVEVALEIPDGADFGPLDTLAVIAGPARAVLAGERVALNFAQRLSGVATLTAAFVAAVDGTMARIAATRKTTPGLRTLEKHAVRLGGGGGHRFGLDDAILIKDNHIAIAGGVSAALMAARARADHMTHIAVEADSLEQLEEALRYSPDVVLLDNFSLPDMKEAVRLAGARCTVEASGGVTLDSVRAIAETGVDVISVGALTHSAPAVDLGLDAAPAA